MTVREPQHGWIGTGEVRLHYWDWPGEEPALLCIHGLTANGRVWDALAEQVGARHRVIAVDLRGRGLSDKPPEGHYGLAKHAEDMAALLKALAVPPVIVVGSSMGAYIGMLLAAEHPSLVGRLVLVDGGGSMEVDPGDETKKQGTPDNSREVVMRRLTSVFESMDTYLDFWRRGAPWIPWTRHFESYLKADVEERADGSVVCRSFAPGILEDTNGAPEWVVEERARNVRVPTLVLWAPMGMGDSSTPPAFSKAAQEQLTRLLPIGRMATIEGANHHTIVLAPDCVKQVTQALEHFLDSSA